MIQAWPTTRPSWAASDPCGRDKFSAIEGGCIEADLHRLFAADASATAAGPPQDLLAHLDTHAVSEPITLLDEFVADRFGSREGDDVVIWQSRVPAGEWCYPPVNRHVITPCLNDVPDAMLCHAGVCQQGALRAGQLVISQAGRSGFCRNSVPGHFLHMGISTHRLQGGVGASRRELQSTRLNVTEIAMAMGFADLSHFSRQFRRHHGVPPSAVLPR